jgi:enoyl-CoA hydratase/carnithine racemase
MTETRTTAEAPVILEEVEPEIFRIRLNRPSQRNAMNKRARVDLIHALDECRGRAKVIIIAGTGTAFCAGVDLKERAAERRANNGGMAPQEHDLDSRRSHWAAVQEEIRRHPSVIIASVNGFALGGGITLINSADLAIAADEARIGIPEIGFGAYAGMAAPSTQLRLGPKHAAWLVLTAERLDGQTAAQWGLVNRSVPLAQLDEEVLTVARGIARFDAITLEWCKKGLNEVPMHISDWNTALDYGSHINAEIHRRTANIRDRVQAFSEGQLNPGQGAAG